MSDTALDVSSRKADGRSSGRIFSPDILTALARLVAGSFIAGFLPAANATFSIARCCTLAVRQDFKKYYTESYPWEVCNFNIDINYSDNGTFPSIVRSMAWAKEYCRGAQLSSLNQWLLPLSTYISPYIGILMMSPLGDVPYHNYLKCKGDKIQMLTAFVNDFLNPLLNVLRKYVQEYISLLGDPSSATFGAMHEVWSDARTLSKIAPPPLEKSLGLPRKALWIAALAGNIRFSQETGWHPEVLRAEGPNTSADDFSPNTAGELENSKEKAPDVISTVKPEKPSEDLQLLVSGSKNNKATDRLNGAIEMMIASQKPFVSAILIPVVLMLAVTAATFYDAYSKTGDKDTALALAYCVWYSWILILGVAGNCYASALSPKVAQKAFKGVLTFEEGPAETALRHRYINGRCWESWAADPRSPTDLGSILERLSSDWFFWLRFCSGQFLGLCCVTFTSACAVVIAWTTPTVGLGCRSFNFILYVILSFVTGYLHVFCSWLSVRSKIQPCGSAKGHIRLQIFRFIYWSLVFVNFLVIVLGTIFHLVGVFRTCWCERLTWSDSTLIELNSKTQQAVDNARRYWVSTGYVDFGIVWMACMIAISFRMYIVQKIDEWDSDGGHSKDKRMNGSS
ncbi:uncharacterized protein Z518_07996 [Rhinocladiella mackenziei CBS 650.93]|uniref:Uncharacterized protein n=1 Tax=Rhinocladiella mackenziei CBS 650.93 TaxID=1442369 RepID=A0A0D2FJF1_9EURO|nr:uncharacterized protein Z518_07996 [Rhinocladiella mackenziei CBS 650.93]KIX02057.1 hypothetical protein Z518_07996 [Rhinocladiella mackenziei CBS 650.93]